MPIVDERHGQGPIRGRQKGASHPPHHGKSNQAETQGQTAEEGSGQSRARWLSGGRKSFVC